MARCRFDRDRAFPQGGNVLGVEPGDFDRPGRRNAAAQGEAESQGEEQGALEQMCHRATNVRPFPRRGKRLTRRQRLAGARGEAIEQSAGEPGGNGLVTPARIAFARQHLGAAFPQHLPAGAIADAGFEPR